MGPVPLTCTSDRKEVLAALDRWTEKFPDSEPAVWWEKDADEPEGPRELEVVWQKPGTAGRITFTYNLESGEASFFYQDFMTDGKEFS